MFSRRIVTLNIEGHEVRLLSVKGKKVEKWGSEPLEEGVVKEGLILQPQAVAQAVDALFKRLKVPKDKAIVSLTGLHSASRFVTLPGMKPDLLHEAIRREAKREMPVPLEELYLSWRSLGKKDDDGQRFFVLGVQRNLVDSEVQVLRESRLKPYMMDLKPLALARAVDRRDALIIDLESDSFSITIVTDGIPVIMRTFTHKAEKTILEDNIRRLADEISRTVEFHNREYPDSPVGPSTPVFLTGEVSDDAATIELIQAGLQYPVEPLSLSLQCPTDFPVGTYAVNIGLALKAIRSKRHRDKDAHNFRDVNFNILPAKYRPRRFPFDFLLISLAVAVAIGGLYPVYQINSEVDTEVARLEQEVDAANEQLRQERVAMNKRQEIKNEIEKTLEEAESLEHQSDAIAAQGKDFTRMLRVITNALPDGCWLSSINPGSDQINLKGKSDDPFSVITYAETLAAKEAFSSVRIASLGVADFAIIVHRRGDSG
ncbi:MAG: pilus assembly protein PilM [Chloroflexota bacterium]